MKRTERRGTGAVVTAGAAVAFSTLFVPWFETGNVVVLFGALDRPSLRPAPCCRSS